MKVCKFCFDIFAFTAVISVIMLNKLFNLHLVIINAAKTGEIMVTATQLVILTCNQD